MSAMQLTNVLLIVVAKWNARKVGQVRADEDGLRSAVFDRPSLQDRRRALEAAGVPIDPAEYGAWPSAPGDDAEEAEQPPAAVPRASAWD
jgi:hypothetical protein